MLYIEVGPHVITAAFTRLVEYHIGAEVTAA